VFAHQETKPAVPRRRASFHASRHGTLPRCPLAHHHVSPFSHACPIPPPPEISRGGSVHPGDHLQHGRPRPGGGRHAARPCPRQSVHHHQGDHFHHRDELHPCRGSPHLHCLRIEANTLLNDLDLDGLSRLNHLIIKNNNDLRTIDLTKMTNLTYLRIDNNDNLETIKLPESPVLQNLYITNNRSLVSFRDDWIHSAIFTLTCLVIQNNDNLIEINFPKLKSLTCLTIDNNKCLTKIKLPELVNFIRFRITNNAELKTVYLPKLVNFVDLNIENNKSLSKINEGIPP